MPTTRSSRGSVLGKRSHQHQEGISAASTASCDQLLQTPDPTPNAKRVRTSLEVVDGDANKENVPPLVAEAGVDISSPRSLRSLRRTTTEFVTPSRPRRSESLRRASSCIIPSRPATPTGELSHTCIATPPPTPPISLLALHVRVRALLRPTCDSVSAEIAGRETERATIQTFLTAFIHSDMETDDAPTTSLYISGSPGTGKTALVNDVLRSTSLDARILFVNCMALNNIDTLWDRLLEELGEPRKSAGRNKKTKGREAVEGILTNLRLKCIIVLDELDHIASSAQTLSTLFSLPNSMPSKLRLIGIANTHTLTSSSSTSSIAASRKVETLHFAPYTPTQLLHILQTRLRPLSVDDTDDNSVAIKKFLPPPTLTLLTKKIATTTGDVRSLFEVLRGAIDLAVTTASSAKGENPLDTPAPSVSPTHILAAIKAYTPSSTSARAKPAVPIGATSVAVTSTSSTSEVMVKVTNLGLQARLVLLAILLASKRIEAGLSLVGSPKSSPSRKATPVKRSSSLSSTSTATVGIDPGQLFTYYSAVLERSDRGVFEPVSRSEFGDLIGVLEGVGLITLDRRSDGSPVSGAKRAFGRSSSFAGSSGFGGTGAKGKGKGDVRVAGGVRTDEVFRGLGISLGGETPQFSDVKQEVLVAIWETEKARLGRDLKVVEREKKLMTMAADGFEGALED